MPVTETNCPTAGFDQDAALSNAALTAAASPEALFLAWVEGDPTAQTSLVVLAQLTP